MGTTITSYEGEIAKRLQHYTSLAHKEGKHNRPAPDSGAPDVNEAALRSEATKWLANEQHLFDRQVTEAARNAASVQGKLIELQDQTSQLLSDDSLQSSVNLELEGHRAELVEAKKARLRAEAELRYFKAASEITEEARYPSSQVLHMGWVVAIFVLEGAVNAFFYENANGLLGGAVVALSIAFINTAFACGFGLGFRYKNLRAWQHQLKGWGCFVAFVLLTLFLNALFSTFRSEYQLVADPTESAQVGQAFKQAWPVALKFFAGDVQFQDHWSLILFFLGVALSVFAFYKGYTLDDRYPRHGAKTRVYKATREREQQVENVLRLKVREMLHHRKSLVQAALNEPTTQGGLLAKRIADVEVALKTSGYRTQAVLRDFSHVLKAYREANLAVRSLPAPVYFQGEVEIEVPDFAATAAPITEDLKMLQSNLKEWIDSSRPQLSARLNELQENSASLMSQTLGAFVAAVQKEAESDIARETPKMVTVAAAV